MNMTFVGQASFEVANGVLKFYSRTKHLYSPIPKAVVTNEVTETGMISLLFLVDALTPDLKPYFTSIDHLTTEDPTKHSNEILKSLTELWEKDFQEKANVNLVDLIETIEFYKKEED